MSTTVFKGTIKPGEISATYRADVANPDPDLLVLGYAPQVGTPISREDSAAPGGFATVSLPAPSKGTIEVLVAMGFDTEKGRLSVMRNGDVVDDEEIQGSTRWIYAVVP